MTLFGILSSRSQRRTFLLISSGVLGVSIVGILLVSHFAPGTPVWAAIDNLLISIVASGVFALVSGLFIQYFFVDPTDIAASSILLPQDIRLCLERISATATEYKIFVRTGRHFRAEILPILIETARHTRRRTRIEVVLLDFRDDVVCDRYAEYRASSSFDHKVWNLRYVKTEVLSTILALIKASRQDRSLVDIHLFLSRRLSTFRIEGSSDEILVTREDPKDVASRYVRSHRDFPAFQTEFAWICDEAYRVEREEAGVLPPTLDAMFADNADIKRLEQLAQRAIGERSPYAR